MPAEQPRPITPAEYRARSRRVKRIAKRLGFVGRVEYRHVSSTTGGAQYGVGATAPEDLLIVYAEAFRRDADPDDYSLEAIVAHERGHQVLCRHPRLQSLLADRLSEATEEILASVVGSLLAEMPRDREALVLKAVGEALVRGVEPPAAARLVAEFRSYLERLL
jgi:hypothetical protein